MSAGVANPIVTENALPGTVGWDQSSTAPSTDIDGYTSEVSVTSGQQVHLHITGALGVRYRVEIYRLGWYQGIGARLQQCVPSCTTDEPVASRPPTPAPDPTTGFLDAGWPVSDVVTLASNSVSGLYLAKLVVTAGGRTVGEARNISFVMREPSPQSAILVQIGVNTDEAYNNWGGKSLYTYNSTGGVAATEVSFDRPDIFMNWEMQWDYPLIRFLESNGYDVSYAADVDTALGVDAPSARRLVIVAGHDEYWSKEIRDALDGAQAAGTNMAFMGANTGYWQMRYANNYRAIFEYRTAAADPDPTPATKTTEFRMLTPPRPECLLEGVQSLNGYAPPPSNRNYQVVAAALSNPWFTGSAFTASSVLTGLVGYEWDMANQPGCPPAQILFTWSGTNTYGQSSEADAATFTAASGARVFAAGSFQYSWGLDGYGHPSTPVDPQLQIFTRNMLDDLSSGGTPPVNAAAPSISGSAVLGQTLAASSGAWSGYPVPTFSYQWERCDTNGANCAPIAGASSSSYTAAVADVGSTLEVVVTATNGTDSSSTASAVTATVVAAPVSAATTVVAAPASAAPPSISGSADSVTTAPVSKSGKATASHAELDGVAKGRPKLSFTLIAGKDAGALKAITISLAKGLRFSRSPHDLAEGIVVKAAGKRLKVAATVSYGKLTITPKTLASNVQFVVASPAITLSTILERQAKAGKIRTLRITLTDTDTDDTTTRITLKPHAR